LLYEISRFSSAIGEFAGKDRRFCVKLSQNEVLVFADKCIETLDKMQFLGNGLLP
jgi:hypothetical protein